MSELQQIESILEEFSKASKQLLETGIPREEAETYIAGVEASVNFLEQDPNPTSLSIVTNNMNMLRGLINAQRRAERHEKYGTWQESRAATFKANEAHYKALSETDPLTKLPSRRAFDIQLEEAVKLQGTAASDTKRGNLSGKKFNYSALLVLDLDRLKSINAQTGHPGGDHAIKEFGRVLSDIARDDEGHLGGRGRVARFGGDEYTLILETHADSQEEAELNFRLAFIKIMERLEGKHFEFDGKTFPLVCGAGMYVIQDGDDPHTIYKKADKALENSKEDMQAKEDRYQKTCAILEEMGVQNLTHLESREEIERRESLGRKNLGHATPSND